MQQPDRIGPYRIERLLGVGSFATVWLGYDEPLDARVAIKVLAENWSHDLRVRERFRDEARLLWRLDHERLVRVHTVGELADGRPYAVLGWADRGSLRDRLAADESLPLPVALTLLREIAAGVAVLHSHQIVHRDLTPGNVLFRSRADGQEGVVIGDLGLAKALAAASGLTARAGTPGYMAPEQDDPLGIVDTRADVYGLGRLGETLLTGTGPAAVPAEIRAVLAIATSPRPDDRYPDAAAFERALAEARPAADSVVEPSAPAPARRRRLRLATGATVVAAAIIAVVASTGGLGWLHDLRAPQAGVDSTGRLSVTLPEGWRAAGSGWSGQHRTDGDLEPAILISPDPDAWRTDPAVPGAFVGLSRALAAEYTPEQFLAAQHHGQCAAPERRTIGQGVIDWVILTFGGCESGKPELVEAAGLTAEPAELVYVQAAPPAGSGPEFIDSLLAGVRITG
ncbi:serine/threonine protein kinase [Natronosporangium hydrolyticum]|uniref:non-specific serine/threonine protein kinase n=1 Tax=Natronosporangium hydrolyticum TaxID=2811111 RepID=A0A895Y947_9ACTN|nr:serine/threonine-protein kinase [Natronosporangium hydrolyticum]QSB12792.1 serine/threonine protein kinase [Natronosporangium hydrolyticum]